MALTENCKTYQSPKENGHVQTSSDVIELNVGGQVYFTRHTTLTSIPNSLLGKLFSAKDNSNDLTRDFRGRFFIDRDGFLFRYVLDYLRDKHVVLPDHFPEKGRLKREAEYFQLPELVKILSNDDKHTDDYIHSDYDDASQGSDQRLYPSYLDPRDRRHGFITVSYKGSCAAGREGPVDPKARGPPKIFICGRIGLAKEVFGDTLHENRDQQRPREIYTKRLLLKFKQLERAFDMLAESGFQLVACNSSLASSIVSRQMDDKQWCSYTEYVFYRGLSGWSSSHCDCCCKSHKSERGEGESGTSFNELSTSCSESHSEASSPQGTVIHGPVSSRAPPIAHTLERERPLHKGGPPPGHLVPGGNGRRRTDMLLRARTQGPREATMGGRGGPRRGGGGGGPPKEKLTVEQELERCIQDFHRIKIPKHFPDRKYMWQSDLLRKYQM